MIKAGSVKVILLSLCLMGLMDLVYLTLTRRLWSTSILTIQGTPLRVDWLAGGMVYLLMALGLWYFILLPRKSVWNAALLGWLVYGVFELTNKAILTNWTWWLVLIDGLYGGFLFGATTWVLKRFWF